MKIYKKYKLLLQYIDIFEKFNDCDDLVEITDEQYHKLQVTINKINESESTVDRPQEEHKEDPTDEQITPTIYKLISEKDYNVSDYGDKGETLDFGWYENSATRYGVPRGNGELDSSKVVTFKHFYWKNNYNTPNNTINDINYITYNGWDRGVLIENFIIDSEVPAFTGSHTWNGYIWQQVTLWVPDELVEKYETICQNDTNISMPKAIRPISEYGIVFRNEIDTEWYLN